jgi:predicted protein tyrosine phosphatase
MSLAAIGLASMRHYLFVCSQYRLRSPTAEHIFADVPGIVTASAGTNNDAENPLTDELVAWADFIFVMERQHRNKLQKKHRQALKDKRLVVLDIPDEYEFMDPELVRLLRAKMQRWLRSS